MLEKIKKVLISINEKKALIIRTQKETEHKVAELDKLLDELVQQKSTVNNIGTNAKIKQLHKTQKS